MFLILISLTLIILLVWDYLYKRRRNHLMNTSGILGPKLTLPLLGHALGFLGNNATNLFGRFDRLCLKYGKVCRLWAGHKLILVVRDPRYFEVILSSHNVLRKPFPYYFLRPGLGDGLLLSFGSKWNARRKMITPAFHTTILDEFVKIFDQQSGILVEHLYEGADGKTVIDIFPKVCLMALDIIAETAMGVKVNAQNHLNLSYVNAITTAVNITSTRMMQPLQYSKLGFILTAFPSYLKLNKCAKIMHDFTDKVIHERRAILQNNIEILNSINDTRNDVGQKKRMVFLDVLLQAQIDGKPLKNDEIREEVDTFMAAGHDTTTSAISFCLYLLARHDAVQQKVFKEIVEVIGDDKDKPVTMRDLQELKYLELVIKEGLRLYSTAPVVGRYIEQDIKVDDKIIPANSNIVFLIYAACRDPDFVDKPNDFIPERYYSELPNKTASFTNIPFSVGPRNCIGHKFAMLEIKSAISKVIRHFELLPFGPDVEPQLNFVLRSSNGMNLGLSPRKY